MSAVRRICAGGIQPVRVVHGDGQVLNFAPTVKVGDVLSRHPHHYLCHVSPDLPSNRSTMLPLDAELEPGFAYFLLPLPRLFPNPGNSISSSFTCSCYTTHEKNHEGEKDQMTQRGGFSPLMIKQMIVRMGSPMRTPKKKVSPEISRQQSTAPSSTNPYSPNFGKENNPLLSPVYKHKRSNSSPKRSSSPKNSKSTCSNRGRNIFSETEVPLCNRWKPRLGCISETDAFVAACEELRVTLDRRRLTFESKGRPGSPIRTGEFSRSPSRMSLGEYCRSPSRELSRTPSKDSYMSPKHGMPLAGYVFV